MRIVVDRREQTPWRFESFKDVELVDDTLVTGDYSLEGLTNTVAVERKSLGDLVLCLGRDHKRFIAEMQRARGLDAFAVIVEGSYRDLAQGRYRSQLNPKAAVATIAVIMARFGFPVLFATGRAEAELACYQFLLQWSRGRCKELELIQDAIGVA